MFCSLSRGFCLYFANGLARFSHGGLVILPEQIPSNFPPQVAFQFFSVQCLNLNKYLWQLCTFH